jgi:diacylglycerol kinase (ATP)
MSIKKILVIVNLAKGKKEALLPIVNEAMQEFGIEWEIALMKKKGDGARFAEEAVKKGFDAVAAYGGDGTIRKIFPGLVGSNVPLAILPGGTANVLSKELGIPQDLKEACRVIGNADARMLDAAHFGKHHFILRIGMGFEADMVKNASREQKNKMGRLAYAMAAVSALKEIEHVRYTIIVDGNKHEVDGVACIVANSGHLGLAGLTMDKHINPSDGLLDVIVLRQANLKVAAQIVPTLIKKELPNNMELVEHWQGKDICISSVPPQPAQVDGKTVEEDMFNVKIIPNAIRVLVPKQEPQQAVAAGEKEESKHG